MSPEQARGKKVDERTDIFAFGALLYEMLTGRRAFPGEDVSDVLAAVLKLDPAWEALPSQENLRSVLRRCLAKEPRKRLRDMGDVRFELERALNEDASQSTGVGLGQGLAWRHVLPVVLGVALAAAGLSWHFSGRSSEPSSGVKRFVIEAPRSSPWLVAERLHQPADIERLSARRGGWRYARAHHLVLRGERPVTDSTVSRTRGYAPLQHRY